MKKIITHYDILQVSQQASASVIRAAFKALSQKWHPDKHQGANETALQKFQNIKQAYDVLSNPELRQEYDHKLQTIDNNNNSSNNKPNKLSSYYSFKEKKTHISVIV